MLTTQRKRMTNLTSRIIDTCQISSSKNLESILFVGYVPPVNQMRLVEHRPTEETMYPLELLYCPDSHLVQISCEVDPSILFPVDYPYTSGTTRILRENFADLFKQSKEFFGLNKKSFVIDIGSNDGTLLSNFLKGGCQVLGIDPTDKIEIANANGIRSIMGFFNKKTAGKVLKEYGQADQITAANVFAHMKDIDDVLDGIRLLLKDDGVFVSENHYLLDLIQTLQYDTIYHEHLRYYSLHALKYLMEKHGLEIFRIKRILTHGGSIRVFSARKGTKKIHESVEVTLQEEHGAGLLNIATYRKFSRDVMQTKLDLIAMLRDIRAKGHKVYGIGAPSRASTLISYVGLDHLTIDCVVEIKGSHKIEKYMPGTLIPVRDETVLYEEQPEYALLLSWHISKELITNLKKRGFKGKFIIPLPQPRIV